MEMRTGQREAAAFSLNSPTASLTRFAHANGCLRRPATAEIHEAEVRVDDARRRRFDILLVHKIDRLGRSLRHLLFTIDHLVELKIQFVSMNEGIDTASITGTFMLQILGALSQMERSKLSERTKIGLERARRQGVRLGRKRPNVSDEAIRAVSHLSVRAAAQRLGVSKSFVHKTRTQVASVT